MILTLLGLTGALLVGHSMTTPSTVGEGGVGHRFCCQDCARDQRQGSMKWGTTCSSCPAPPPPCGPIVDCDAPVYDEYAIDDLVARATAEGLRDQGAITLRVLQQLYQTTPDGRMIDWPNIKRGSASCLRLLKAAVYSRVGFVLACKQHMVTLDAWRKAGHPERGES